MVVFRKDLRHLGRFFPAWLRWGRKRNGLMGIMAHGLRGTSDAVIRACGVLDEVLPVLVNLHVLTVFLVTIEPSRADIGRVGGLLVTIDHKAIDVHLAGRPVLWQAYAEQLAATLYRCREITFAKVGIVEKKVYAVLTRGSQ